MICRCIGECFAIFVNWFHCSRVQKPSLLSFSHQLLLPCARKNSIRFLTVQSFKSFVCYSKRNSICALSSTAFLLPIYAHKASNQFQFTEANCGRKRWRWFFFCCAATYGFLFLALLHPSLRGQKILFFKRFVDFFFSLPNCCTVVNINLSVIAFFPFK